MAGRAATTRSHCASRCRYTHCAVEAFGSKLRSQIKRAERESYDVIAGGSERVTDFYPVFAEVMRDLGTPVYPRRFFDELARQLPEFCTILAIRREGRPVAAAFLVGDRGTLEIPWAGTITTEKPKATNMLLYAEVLKLAVDRGYATFDFGRSTLDSGPYRFKRQWGAEPVQLHWAVWPEETNSDNGRPIGPCGPKPQRSGRDCRFPSLIASDRSSAPAFRGSRAPLLGAASQFALAQVLRPTVTQRVSGYL